MIVMSTFDFQAESLESPKYLPPATKADKLHFKECLIELLQVCNYWLLALLSYIVPFQDMFGEESVPKIFSGDRITVSVDTRKAVIDLASLEVSTQYCRELVN